jgi:hypothetical protein
MTVRTKPDFRQNTALPPLMDSVPQPPYRVKQHEVDMNADLDGSSLHLATQATQVTIRCRILGNCVGKDSRTKLCVQ